VLTDGAVNLGSQQITGTITLRGGNNSAAAAFILSTLDDSVRLNGAVILHSGATIDTDSTDTDDGGFVSGTGGVIRFTNDAPVDSASGETNAITFDAGHLGIFFNEDLGANQRLGAFTVEEAGGGITFGETDGDVDNLPLADQGQVNQVLTDGAVNLGSQQITGTITLRGGNNSAAAAFRLSTLDDSVRLNGAVVLHSGATLDTDSTDTDDGGFVSGTGGVIRFTNDAPVDSASGETNAITFDAGHLGIFFNEDLG